MLDIVTNYQVAPTKVVDGAAPPAHNKRAMAYSSSCPRLTQWLPPAHPKSLASQRMSGQPSSTYHALTTSKMNMDTVPVMLEGLIGYSSFLAHTFHPGDRYRDNIQNEGSTHGTSTRSHAPRKQRMPHSYIYTSPCMPENKALTHHIQTRGQLPLHHPCSTCLLHSDSRSMHHMPTLQYPFKHQGTYQNCCNVSRQ